VFAIVIAAVRRLAGLLMLVVPLAVLAEPRIAPLAAGQWNEHQRAVAETLSGPLTNASATFLHHPVLLSNLIPFERYISSESTLAARDRELLILRTAWLCRSSYVWAQRVDAARRAGISDAELERIARGPDAPGWKPLEAALLSAADELHVDAFISDATWTTLRAAYTNEQLVDLVFTVGEFTMISASVNSLKIEIEPARKERLPYGIPYTTVAKWTNKRLIGQEARLPPIERSDWTPAIRELLDPRGTGRRVANVYGTYIHSLDMDLLRRRVSEHIRDETSLSDWQREVLLIRIGVLCRSEYEWAAHSRVGRRIGMGDEDIERIVAGPSADNDDPVERALLRATDEIYRDDLVSDETWNALTVAFNERQLLDILTAIGGYRMFSMAINTFGVQLDPGMEDARFPAHLR